MSAIGPHLLLSLIVAYPVFVIFKRVGMHQGLTFLVFIPVVGLLIVGLILSYRDWQGDDYGA